MSGRRARAERKAEYADGGKSTKDGKSTAKTKKGKLGFWLSLGACAFFILVGIIALIGGNSGSAGASAFSFSEGITNSGFWKNTKASDYVELFDYLSLPIPREVHEISDETLQAEIDSLMGLYSLEATQVTDRAVEEGDKVNIDYVGSVDGVPFDGGSTWGEGTEVTAGSAAYIDDFLTQIIGHTPGETFDVEVTFPEDYGQEALNGKDAVFETTINYIAEYTLTDAFVEENLYDAYGWTTVDDMERGKREELHEAAVENYVRTYLADEVVVHAMPDAIASYQEKLIAYQEKAMLEYYESQAESYEMDLDTLLQIYMGVSGREELIEVNRESIVADIRRSLVAQAVAEDAGISVSHEDIDYYMPDHETYEEYYGLPWLTQYVLVQKVLDLVIENAVFV